MSHTPGGPRRRGVDPTRKAANMGAALRRLLNELRPQRRRLTLALIATFVAVAATVAAPIILGRATDVLFSGLMFAQLDHAGSKEQAVTALRANGNDTIANMVSSMDVTPGSGIDFTTLGSLLLVVLGMYLIAGLLGWVAGLLIRSIVQDTGYDIRQRVQRKIDSVPLSYIDRHSRGDLMSRVSNDVDNMTQVLNQALSQFLNSTLTVIGIIAMMLAMSWKLTLLSLVALPVGMGLVGVLMKRAQPYFRAQWKHTGEVSGIVEEAMTGHDVALLYGVEDNFDATMKKSNTALYSAAVHAQFVSNLVMPLMNMISSLTYVIVAVAGGLMVAGGTMTLGGVQAFIQYSRQFMHPLGTLASMASSLQSGAASAERVFEFLDTEDMTADITPASSTAPTQDEASSAGKSLLPTHVQGRIEFHNVRFGYTPDTTVIKGLSLNVEPGHMVAIIGPTGAGKTTLVNLLMRFYDLDSGHITLDGVDIATVPRSDLRQHMGMVLQDTWLFDGTIAENIAFGRKDATLKDVIAAAEATGADRLIRQLPEGYNTRVSDDSDALSAGERQLVTIARAFVSQPDILILDEATSSVDTRTEVLVQRAMDTLRQGRTAFVIAHRLSTIRDADLILVMEEGDVVEMGSHEELLAHGGAYARLLAAATPE